MGLIKAALGSASGVLADEWKEFFYCDSMASNVLVSKGQKRVSKRRSSNKKGDENIISNGSVIAVNEGQCMMIVEQGGIVEFSAEAGQFVWDSSTEPSIFTGSFGKGLIDMFKQMARRFTFGGDTGKDQRVYFFNTKEIVGNKYGTPTPVPFRVVDRNIGLDVDISIRCNGEFSYRISNPMLFYRNVCGNVSDTYTRDMIDSQLKSELLTALQPAFSKISEKGIRYSALPGHTTEIAEELNNVLSSDWKDIRGIEIVSFGLNSINASKEDEDMIKELQKRATMRDPSMAAATIVGAQADAMKRAASNPNGAMMGFMGMGMAQNAGGMNAQALFNMASQNNQNNQNNAQSEQKKPSWKCSCGAENTGKFCVECGAKKPNDEQGWTCAKCNTVNKGNFCMECGEKRPANAPLYRCDKCGWEPKDPKNPPKFCPECGDIFNEDDKR